MSQTVKPILTIQPAVASYEGKHTKSATVTFQYHRLLSINVLRVAQAVQQFDLINDRGKNIVIS